MIGHKIIETYRFSTHEKNAVAEEVSQAIESVVGTRSARATCGRLISQGEDEQMKILNAQAQEVQSAMTMISRTKTPNKNFVLTWRLIPRRKSRSRSPSPTWMKR
jgi:hypothetical protein